MKSLQAPKSSWQFKIAPLFTVIGWLLVGLSFLTGLLVLSPTASSYWGATAKATRDAAEVGSALIGQLGLLTVTPRWLEPLTFLGAAAFMVGIALLFSTIPAILQNRGQVIKEVFPLIARSGDELH